MYTRVHRAAEGWPPLATQYIRNFVSMSVSAGAPVCILLEAKCTIDYLGFVYIFIYCTVWIPLAGNCGWGIPFHVGEFSSALLCCFPCSPNSCCPLDNVLVVFTPVREVISEMDSSVKDCWVAVGSFTGLGVGLLWRDCSCSEKDAIIGNIVPVLSCSMLLSQQWTAKLGYESVDIP